MLEKSLLPFRRYGYMSFGDFIIARTRISTAHLKPNGKFPTFRESINVTLFSTIIIFIFVLTH